MTKTPSFKIDSKWILDKRGPKNSVSEEQAYAYFVEEEYSINGKLEAVATVFLTNRECPFRCLMCDLWKNTTDAPISSGSIVKQLKEALEALPPAKHIKLYNSGNFFDPKAIPLEDYNEIAALCNPFESVLVEAHPKFIGSSVLDFKAMLKGELQVAIGLETIHPEVMEVLNKRMTLNEFSEAAQFLKRHGINSRAFVLLRPPLLNEQEGIHWAIKSVEFAFESGVECVSIIPTRFGNGALEGLAKEGLFEPPAIKSLEYVQSKCLELKKGRVFADLWDVEQFFNCNNCNLQRAENIEKMNKGQKSIPKFSCPICDS